MDAALVLSLADRVTTLAGRSAMHPASQTIGARVDTWARAQGLVLGDPQRSPLGRARFERLTGRIFPKASEEKVALFTRWLVWLFALDDAVDDTSLGGSATAVHGLYRDLLGALRRGHAKPDARQLELVLADLWRDTAPGMSRQWRRRFLRHMEEHRAGCAEEAVNRRTCRMPSPKDFAELRRRSAGPFMYDLVEPMLGVELDPELAGSPAWKALVDGTADMITWVNDVVSYHKETNAGRVVSNHVAMVRIRYGMDAPQAACRVVDHIARRAPQVMEAARAAGAELDRLDLGEQARRNAAAVVRILLRAPRAHMDWLAETARYTPLTQAPVVPMHRAGPRARPRLDDRLGGPADHAKSG